MTALRVLLISPFPGTDPPTGDVTFTENLLASPPSDVIFESHVDALQSGRLRERARRSALRGSRPAWARVVDVALLMRERAVNWSRSRGLLPWEPFRYFEVVGAYDLVHVHTFSVRLTGRVPPLIVSNGASTTDLYRDARHWSRRRTAALLAGDRLLARLFRVVHVADPRSGARRMITFTEHLRQWYLSRGAHPDWVAVIAPGVPRGSASKSGGGPADPPVVGFIASDFWAKGGDVLLGAVPEIVRHHPEVTIVIAGSELDPASVVEHPNVRWIGRKTRSELGDEVFPSFDVLAYPTRFDGASLVVQEALSFGVPLAVSDYGPIPEMVGHGAAGLISEVGDVVGLALDVVQILDPANYSRLSAGAEQHFAATYEEGVCRRRLRSLYDAVLDEVTPRRQP